ncbi:MAG: Mut7-C RNAse domain-containing protein [Candidatus Micrarchaeia archaeon]
MIFVADVMLKKLARWLRILGIETLYPTDASDDALLALAKEKGAVLLTQDVELAARARRHRVRAYLVPRGLSTEQALAKLAHDFEIPIEDFPSRTLCPKCNGRLRTVGREAVQGRVHADLTARHATFWLCDGCGQIYWEGSHWKKITRGVERIMAMLREMTKASPRSPHSPR